MKPRVPLLSVLLVLFLASVSSAGQPGALHQISTIEALLDGSYDGQASFSRLAKHGDFGLGTVDKLNGEMVALDGEFYQVTVDGKVHRIPLSMTTPFANVTFFKESFGFDCPAGLGYDELKKLIDEKLPSRNLFYAIRVDGLFPRMKVRSVPAATKKPYPKLVEVVKHQKVYDYRVQEGTLVGFYCPSFVKGVNVPGYHMHFLGSKRQKGGHVLALETPACRVRVAILNRLNLVLPDKGDFLHRDLGRERKHQLEKVEKDS